MLKNGINLDDTVEEINTYWRKWKDHVDRMNEKR
jgi:hypothetical protein